MEVRRPRLPCDNASMTASNGRRSQKDRDADTVEIVYALLSGLFLAIVVFGVIAGPAFIWNMPARLTRTLLMVGAAIGAILAVVRIIHVLRAHAKRGRMAS